MEANKEKIIRNIVDVAIKSFADGFEGRHIEEVDNPLGTINMKKNNCFISALGPEFVFYSAFVRSFDSSFGTVLENIGNTIAKLTYITSRTIESFILPEQTTHIANLLDKYEKHDFAPDINHYENFYTVCPPNIESYRDTHVCDNWFFDTKTKTHYLIELKSGGDLDNKKAKSEKLALLKEYFLLKNKVNSDEKIVLKFATAYNKFGEDNDWHQSNVETFFSKDELLIGKKYWNFVCDDEHGFDVIFDQYLISSKYIKEAIIRIRNLYSCS